MHLTGISSGAIASCMPSVCLTTRTALFWNLSVVSIMAMVNCSLSTNVNNEPKYSPHDQ